MNSLEMQLRSWEPRRPSAELERRIFRSRAGRLPSLAEIVRWLAPVTACALLAITVASRQERVPSTASSRPPSMMAMIPSNQSPAAILSDDLQFAASNCIAASNCSFGTFEWTNRSGSTSGASSFVPDRVN